MGLGAVHTVNLTEARAKEGKALSDMSLTATAASVTPIRGKKPAAKRATRAV